AAVARANMTGSSIYGRTALRDECAALAAMRKDSGRNNALNTAAFSLFQLVAGGELDEEKDQMRERLVAAPQACKLVADDGAASVRATIESGAKAGRAQPRQAQVAGTSDATTEGEDAALHTVDANDVGRSVFIPSSRPRLVTGTFMGRGAASSRTASRT